MGKRVRAVDHRGLAERGRGAQTNASGRYEALAREAFDDGWTEEERAPRRTSITKESARSIITRNQSPDIGFDRSINPYQGCEHGCSYCYARPGHAYYGLSPGLDFETKLFVKPDAPRLLEKALSRPGYRPKPIALGASTDPYQPIERQYGLTRAVLKVLDAFSHPVIITTKGALVARDADILGPMARRRLVKVALSITTLDRKLARAMEPRAPTPEKRLAALGALSEAGVPVTVMMAPIIPALNDEEIEELLARVAEAGASRAAYVLLRMPLEIKDLFREWLEATAPDRAKRVVKLLREMRGGRDYDAKWYVRQRGDGPYAALIAQRFERAASRAGLNGADPELDLTAFRPPPRAGDQLALF